MPTDPFSLAKISWFHRNAPSTKWATHIYMKNQLGSSVISLSRRGITLSTAKISSLNCSRGFCAGASISDRPARRRRPNSVAEAQAALMDYLYVTRGLPFTDAEHMTKNSPIFLDKLLNKVDKEVDKEESVSRVLRRFLCYHPINEFEPFFESLGLQPCEFDLLLPGDLFLSNDEELLGNYLVLCNYGISRGNIGKMYKEASGIFRYKSGILSSKLRAYEELGLSKSSIIKVVASCPSLLIGDIDDEFVKVLEELEGIGIERDWIGGVLFENESYHWSRMLTVFQFFTEMCFSKQEVGGLIRSHPDFLVHGSGKILFSLVVLLSKLGGTKMEMFSMFSEFPCVKIEDFVRNFWRGLLFLIKIEMSSEDIQKIMRTHTKIFGLYSLKKANSILTYLNIGKKRLCRIIIEDPHQLKKYTFGSTISRLPKSPRNEKSLKEKKTFLLHLGFVEDSTEMEKALTVFRGRGDELQDRYNILVQFGLDPKDVSNMIQMAPHILNQKKDVLESKIEFLVKNLGYPLSSLSAYPQYLCCDVEKVKLRFLMYNWLKARGKVSPTLALSTIVACSDKLFRKRFISRHPEGLEVWEQFRHLSSS